VKLNTHLYIVLRCSFTLTFSVHMYNMKLSLVLRYGVEFVRAAHSCVILQN